MIARSGTPRSHNTRSRSMRNLAVERLGAKKSKTEQPSHYYLWRPGTSHGTDGRAPEERELRRDVVVPVPSAVLRRVPSRSEAEKKRRRGRKSSDNACFAGLVDSTDRLRMGLVHALFRVRRRQTRLRGNDLRQIGLF